MTEPNKEISNLKIILKGTLMVNLPVFLTVFGVGTLTLTIFDITFNYSIIIGAIVGWILWNKLVDQWVKWGLNNNISKDRLFELGKRGFINYSRRKIYGPDESPD